MVVEPAAGGPAADLLEVSGLRKRFGGVVALDGVDLTVRAGEIHALVGENGAGKSTLIQIVTGVFAPDDGSIRLSGTAVQLDAPASAQRHGIVAVYQELSLVEDLDVAQNVFLGREPRIAGPILDKGRLYRDCTRLLHDLGIQTIDPTAPIWSLSVADRQLVELARALSQQAQLVILDEPTSALPTPDEERLLGLLADMRDRGTSVLYVTHRLAEVFRIADRVTVLRDGKVVWVKPVRETTPDQLVQAMVGRDLAQHLFPPRPAARRSEVTALDVEDLASPGLFESVSFGVGRGEIVGLAGLIGAGRSSVLRSIFGADPRSTGTVRLDGDIAPIDSPRRAIEFGLALVSEDRRLDSVALRLNVTRNITAVDLPSRSGLVDSTAALTLATEAARDVELRGSLERLVGELSGGNQQKVAIGKWLSSRPRVLLCDEPTRGIDVGAKAEIYELLRRLADDGMAVLFASSELPEILGLAERVLVMFEGRLMAEFDAASANEASIMRAASGIADREPVARRALS